MNASDRYYLFAVLSPKMLDELTKDEFASLLDVNILGTFLVSKVTIITIIFCKTDALDRSKIIFLCKVNKCFAVDSK